MLINLMLKDSFICSIFHFIFLFYILYFIFYILKTKLYVVCIYFNRCVHFTKGKLFIKSFYDDVSSHKSLVFTFIPIQQKGLRVCQSVHYRMHHSGPPPITRLHLPSDP